MDINFNKSTKLSSLQSDFQKRFNYLKIEFFRKTTRGESDFKPQNILNTSLSIGEVSQTVSSDPMHINGLMKVSEIEHKFSEKLGIAVQVFRKSGKVWLLTSSSDHLTLDQLNKEAAEKEIVHGSERQENDYHEQE
jgi:hypothetical protein